MQSETEVYQKKKKVIGHHCPCYSAILSIQLLSLLQVKGLYISTMRNQGTFILKLWVTGNTLYMKTNI